MRSEETAKEQVPENKEKNKGVTATGHSKRRFQKSQDTPHETNPKKGPKVKYN